MYLSQDPIGLAGNNPTLYGYVRDINSWVDVLGLDGKTKVFWSGGEEAKKAAEKYAKSVDGEILEMTPQGKALEKWTNSMDWETEAKPLWNQTSQHFAGSIPSTQTSAKVFIDPSRYRGSESVWEQFEKPILKKKGVAIEEVDIKKKTKATCH
jgi:uncharacterized protein RhaS with RHS repeats